MAEAHQKIIIVGGVAGGASCATRLRRLNEKAQIIMVERGPYVSFANCGLPYHLGGAIPQRESLLVTKEEDLKLRFNLDVRSNTEALSIDRKNRLVKLQNRKTHEITMESYDQLVLSPGAEPFKPAIEGLDSEGVFTLRNIPDLDRILHYIQKHQIKSAAVLGAGFIGIEVAENLKERGIAVRLIEKAPQVMPLYDLEMAALIQKEMTVHGVQIETSCDVIRVVKKNSAPQLTLQTASGEEFATELLVVAIGVRPETTLAKEAGLELGSLGGIKVDSQFRTNDPNIFAVGDAIETIDQLTGSVTKTPLAGPANRQGRMVADVIMGRSVRYHGTIGTSILKVFSLTAASVGLSEKAAQRAHIPYRVAWTHGNSHSSYYPNAKAMTLKLLFAPESGEILGAQVVGEEGVDKRMDVFATALTAEMTVFDLEELDLSYAPPYSSAKDPVNTIGMIASGILRGDQPSFHWSEIEKLVNSRAFILDVRRPVDLQQGMIKNAHFIPLEEIRQSLDEIPKNQPIWIYCQQGYRGYVATRLLRQLGYEAYNLLGGFKLWSSAPNSFSLIVPKGYRSANLGLTAELR